MTSLNLSAEQLERYARQLVLEGFGRAGQAALQEAAVVVVGAGGLGAPAVMYLAGAGVGRLGIVDDDVVERSNLHRQPIHGERDVDRPKAVSAKEWVTAYNPDVDVVALNETFDASLAESIVPEYDLVVDATDRFAARFLINDACVLHDRPFVHGAVHRFEGQVAAFDPGADGPCYRCIFPEAPPAGAVPDCATAGVLGPVPGVVGSMEAIEAIKLIADIGDPAVGRLLVLDALGLTVDEVAVRADPDCPVCGDGRTIGSLSDIQYDDRCRIELEGD